MKRNLIISAAVLISLLGSPYFLGCVKQERAIKQTVVLNQRGDATQDDYAKSWKANGFEVNPESANFAQIYFAGIK